MFKQMLVSWLIKGVEIVIVAILGLLIWWVVKARFGEGYLGTIAVAIVFYFFGGIMRPYIKDIQNKIAKKLKKSKKETKK